MPASESLLVHVPADFRFTADLFPTNHNLHYVPAPSLEEAHVIVQSDGDEIVIEPRTGAMAKCQHQTRFMLGGKSKHLPYALNSIANFTYLLEHHNEADPFEGQFTLEMHRLRDKPPKRTVDETVGHNGNLIVDGVVRFPSEEDAVYGFTIRNTSLEALVPHVFFFDPEEYTIHQWYPYQKQEAVPLPAKTGTLTLGMGTETAYQFLLPQDKRESSGFLKLVMTREAVGLRWIEQPVPLIDAKYPVVGGRHNESLDHLSGWDALTVTLTMTAEH
ncbi:hypothetical protein DFH08DRAFT_908307 [Mycena albidolilacea]|uniref:Uncharacterized protein n=1 Tax=Mycena albidolilacea TaxID=1033008 RepID=A0AAD6YWJ8_9AGAR|nr:hypothetical protein DFH08DRAFT_908307 [Mycena albidolilacea]